MEFSLLWAALTGMALLWLGSRIWPGGGRDRAFDSLLGATLFGLLVGRLVAMLAQGVNPLIHPADIIVIRGGVHTGAAALAAILAVVWTQRRAPAVLDTLAPSALLGLAGWHAGCLWRSACLGTASDLPWAWSGPASDIARHPVELYAAAALLGAAWLLGRPTSRMFLRAGSALVFAGAVRLLTEPMRPSLTGGPLWWYVAAIGVGVATAILGNCLRAPLGADVGGSRSRRAQTEEKGVTEPT